MTGGTFANCEACGRLLIWGQRCVCARNLIDKRKASA